MMLREYCLCATKKKKTLFNNFFYSVSVFDACIMMHDVEPGCAVICFQSEECIHVVEADTEYVFLFCPAMRRSSESFKFMQMKSDFQERQPIGKKTVELM